jgi:hypothetical protein
MECKTPAHSHSDSYTCAVPVSGHCVVDGALSVALTRPDESRDQGDSSRASRESFATTAFPDDGRDRDSWRDRSSRKASRECCAAPACPDDGRDRDGWRDRSSRNFRRLLRSIGKLKLKLELRDVGVLEDSKDTSNEGFLI